MKPIETVYKKCEKTINGCKNTIQLDCVYKMVDQFNYLYKKDKNFDTYSTLLSATLHMKSNELK